MMKLVLAGMHIPKLLPSLAADLFFAARQECEVWIIEKNDTMGKLMVDYLSELIRHSGVAAKAFSVGNEAEALDGAHAVIYAGDCQPGSRYNMDREAMESPGQEVDPENPGLLDQLRLSGGLEGLLRTLRAGEPLLHLVGAMKTACPEALVVNLSQPLSRTTLMFHQAGFRVIGLGSGTAKSPQGVESLCHALGKEKSELGITWAGLNQFTWLTSVQLKASGQDYMTKVRTLVKNNQFGDVLTRRWMDWYGAVALGDTQRHGEFLPAQPDFHPVQSPDFGEDVDSRKERILHMNTVATKGAASREGGIAQITLLAKAPAQRPIQCALAVLNKDTLSLAGAVQVNQGLLPQLPESYVVEAPLHIVNGQAVPSPVTLPDAVAGVCRQVGQSDLLAASAATGDRQAFREYMETDIAMEGMDRLYLTDVAYRLVRLHEDILTRY